MKTTTNLAFTARVLAIPFLLAQGLLGCGGGGGDAAPNTTSTGGSVALTAVTLHRVDASGTNLGSVNNLNVGHGAWTTLVGAQNVPNNYEGHLFLSKVADPTAADLLAVANPLSIALTTGTHTFYFFANSDDQLGGTFGFGVNLWFAGAAANAPALSAFAQTPSSTGAFAANSTTGCTGAYDGSCVPGSGALVRNGTPKVTMTALQIIKIGGAAASSSCTDKVGGTNTVPTIVTSADGICDTVGSFTLTVE